MEFTNLEYGVVNAPRNVNHGAKFARGYDAAFDEYSIYIYPNGSTVYRRNGNHANPKTWHNGAIFRALEKHIPA
jgi:hypothetical protein